VRFTAPYVFTAIDFGDSRYRGAFLNVIQIKVNLGGYGPYSDDFFRLLAIRIITGAISFEAGGRS